MTETSGTVVQMGGTGGQIWNIMGRRRRRLHAHRRRLFEEEVKTISARDLVLCVNRTIDESDDVCANVHHNDVIVPRWETHTPNKGTNNTCACARSQKKTTLNILTPPICACATNNRFVQYVSMDVEGFEPNVFSTWPWDLISVGVFIVETAGSCSGCRCDSKCQKVREILLSKGYMLAPVTNAGVDDYYVLPKYWHDSLASKKWRDHPVGSHGC